MTTPLGQRLKQSRLNANLTQDQVAEAVGIKQSTYQALESGKNQKSAFITQIANILKVDAKWLLLGEGVPDVDANIQKLLENSSVPLLNEQHNNEGRTWIDVVNIRFSCGVGESIEFHFDEVLKRVSFDQEFFKQYKVKPENMKIALATGDSQEPYIRSGDMFAIDLTDTEIKDGEFYAVYFEGEAMLKQLIKEPGGVVVLHSLNQKYKDKVITNENGTNFRVIGRQFWRAG